MFLISAGWGPNWSGRWRVPRANEGSAGEVGEICLSSEARSAEGELFRRPHVRGRRGKPRMAGPPDRLDQLGPHPADIKNTRYLKSWSLNSKAWHSKHLYRCFCFSCSSKPSNWRASAINARIPSVSLSLAMAFSFRAVRKPTSSNT